MAKKEGNSRSARLGKVLSRYHMLFRAEHNSDLIRGHAGGTTLLEISKRNFCPRKFIVLSTEKVAVFEQLVEPLHGWIIVNLREGVSFVDLRDTLLPKLISGEVRMPAAGEMLEDVP